MIYDLILQQLKRDLEVKKKAYLKQEKKEQKREKRIYNKTLFSDDKDK